jgi:outer membrane protein OmpA-like peptidoglycan-associated protein
VDKTGCPMSTLLQIDFQTDKYDIAQKDMPKIEEFADFLKENSGYQAIIYSYTDNTKGKISNRKLSQNRAIAIMDALISLGIKLTRLTAIGMGSKNPIADNETPEGRAKNHRIEIELLQ